MSKLKLFKSVKKIFTLFVMALSLFTTIIAQPVSAVFATDINVESLHYLANQERGSNGLTELNLNDNLSQAALAKANHMLTNNYWDHNAPDGTEPWSFVLDSGYSYKTAGENLAKGFGYSDDVVSGWMNSPTHRDNVLKEAYVDVGYAVVNGVLLGEETTLVVAMYGVPKISSTKASNANSSVTVSMVVEATESNSGIAKPASGRSDDSDESKMQGLVKGIIASEPVSKYLSADMDIKLIIMIICLIFLAMALRLLLTNINGKHGYKCIYFRKRPVFGSIILIATFMVAIVSSLGVVLG